MWQIFILFKLVESSASHQCQLSLHTVYSLSEIIVVDEKKVVFFHKHLRYYHRCGANATWNDADFTLDVILELVQDWILWWCKLTRTRISWWCFVCRAQCVAVSDILMEADISSTTGPTPITSNPQQRMTMLKYFMSRTLWFQGEHLAHAAHERHVQCTALAWHPIKKILASGWQNGEVAIWNEQERESYEAVRMHNVEITILHWTSNGTRLVSGDAVSTRMKSYRIIVW